jgi:hypothetical protein
LRKTRFDGRIRNRTTGINTRTRTETVSLSSTSTAFLFFDIIVITMQPSFATPAIVPNIFRDRVILQQVYVPVYVPVYVNVPTPTPMPTLDAPPALTHVDDAATQTDVGAATHFVEEKNDLLRFHAQVFFDDDENDAFTTPPPPPKKRKTVASSSSLPPATRVPMPTVSTPTSFTDAVAAAFPGEEDVFSHAFRLRTEGHPMFATDSPPRPRPVDHAQTCRPFPPSYSATSPAKTPMSAAYKPRSPGASPPGFPRRLPAARRRLHAENCGDGPCPNFACRNN